MRIVIRSATGYNEVAYDRAYGLAKTLIITGRRTAVKRIEHGVLTARATPESVIVTIRLDVTGHTC